MIGRLRGRITGFCRLTHHVRGQDKEAGQRKIQPCLSYRRERLGSKDGYQRRGRSGRPAKIRSGRGELDNVPWSGHAWSGINEYHGVTPTTAWLRQVRRQVLLAESSRNLCKDEAATLHALRSSQAITHFSVVKQATSSCCWSDDSGTGDPTRPLRLAGRHTTGWWWAM